MRASFGNQIENAKMLMEAGANPFLTNKLVRLISSSSISFHICRVKQQEMLQEKRVILILKDSWRHMREILRD